MYKRTTIALFALIVLSGCRSNNLQKELQSSETVGFPLGTSREQVFNRLKTMNAKLLSDANGVVLVEVPVKHPVQIELTFKKGKLRHVTYTPAPE